MTAIQPESPVTSARKPPDANLREPVEISVAHHPDLVPPFAFQGPTGPPVDVKVDGDVTIDWGEESSRVLRFRLADDSPEALLEGIQLGWPGAPADAAATAPRFELACEADAEGRRRALRLVLYPCSEVFPYTLTVSHGGKTYRLDPKIYNQGDGGTPGA